LQNVNTAKMFTKSKSMTTCTGVKWLIGFPVILKRLTLNNLEMLFSDKIFFHRRFDWIFLPRFRQQQCENERRHFHAVSNRNVRQWL